MRPHNTTPHHPFLSAVGAQRVWQDGSVRETLPSFHVTSCKLCQESCLSFPAPASVSIKTEKKISIKISHTSSAERNDVMASASNLVDASQFLSTYKSTVQGLPQLPAPRGTFLSHAVHLPSSRVVTVFLPFPQRKLPQNQEGSSIA